MNRVLASVALLLLLCPLAPHAATLFTTPVMLVSPPALDFGPVATNRSATNTFLVENAGGGKLVGKATLSSPFKIISGASYSLAHNEAQVITVVYSPRTVRTNFAKVSFSGAGGTKATVSGRGSPASPAPSSLDLRFPDAIIENQIMNFGPMILSPMILSESGRFLRPVSSLAPLEFGFVSDFGFRISDFF